ncbi:MAG: hypothetical protein R3F14_43255 [Polyangiaceae bacterium]
MTTRRALAPLVLAFLVGCGATPADHPVAKPAPGFPTSLQVSGAALDGTFLLAEDAALATTAGAGRLSVLGTEIAAEGDRVGAFVEIPRDECLLAYARPSPTIADVDLFAFEDDGSPFATDESPNQGGTLLVCPPHPRRLYIVARVMAGMGMLAVGAQTVAQSKSDAVAKVVHARGRPGEDTGRLDAWPGLESKLREHRTAVGGRWDDIRRVAVPVTPRAVARVSIALDAHRCADVLIAPSEEIASLDTVVEDANGRVIARARERGRDRSAVICAESAAEISVAMRPRASQGLVAVVIGRSAPGAAAEIAQSVFADHVTQPKDLATARSTLSRALTGRGYSAPTATTTGSARTGQRTTVTVDVPAGCARLDLIPGAPLGSFRADLWDDQSALLTRTYGGTGATFFTCGKAGSFRTDIEALDAPGPFAVELRKEKTSPPVLVAHPFAAARLLGRLEASGTPTDAAAAKDAQSISLSSGALRTVPFTVPQGACTEVIAALDGTGQGLDLRLVSTATGDSTLVRGATVASDRLCAGPAPLSAKAELRLTTGQTDALLLTRPLPP